MAYSQEEREKIVSQVCDLIGDGLSLRKALPAQGSTVSRKTFFEWIDDNESFRNQYARACEDRTHKMADEILEIADFSANDTIETEKGDMPDNEWINRSKLRVDARKWLMAKMLPKVYGDKIDVTSDGEKLSAPPINIYTSAPPMASSEDEIDETK